MIRLLQFFPVLLLTTLLLSSCHRSREGMQVTCKLSQPEMLLQLAGPQSDPVLRESVLAALAEQSSDSRDFLILFRKAFETRRPGVALSSYFAGGELAGHIPAGCSNEQMLEILRQSCDSLYEQTLEVLQKRLSGISRKIDILKIREEYKVQLTVKGTRDTASLLQLIGSRGRLEFWETYTFSDLYPIFSQANQELAKMAEEGTLEGRLNQRLMLRGYTLSSSVEADKDSPEMGQGIKKSFPATGKLLSKIRSNENEEKSDFERKNPLFSILRPEMGLGDDGLYHPFTGSVTGRALAGDTILVNCLLEAADPDYPWSLKLCWGKPLDRTTGELLTLYALKRASHEEDAALFGNAITKVRTTRGKDEYTSLHLKMNKEGTDSWRRITHKNIRKQLAVVLDGFVLTCPRVNDEVKDGNTSLDGNFSTQEALNLQFIIEYGMLPAKVTILHYEAYSEQ